SSSARALCRLCRRQEQCVPKCVHPLGDEVVEHPRSAALAGEEAGVGQHLQMVAHGWLREAERCDQVAHAGLAARLSRDETQQAETARISDRLERVRQRLGVIPPEVLPEQRGTAAWRLGIHRRKWILTYVDVMDKYIDIRR